MSPIFDDILKISAIASNTLLAGWVVWKIMGKSWPKTNKPKLIIKSITKGIANMFRTKKARWGLLVFVCSIASIIYCFAVNIEPKELEIVVISFNVAVIAVVMADLAKRKQVEYLKYLLKADEKRNELLDLQHDINVQKGESFDSLAERVTLLSNHLTFVRDNFLQRIENLERKNPE